MALNNIWHEINMKYMALTKFRRVGKVLSFVTTSLLFSTAAIAQTPPNAGTVSRDAVVVKPAVPQTNTTLPQTGVLAPPASKSTDPTPIPIKSITITGATLFSADVLHALVANVATGTHTLGELQEAANRITAHYRKAGYFLARAYLPAQKMEGGQVTIAVLEGKLEQVKLENTSRVSDALVNARLAHFVSGTVLRKEPLDRALLLLGELPGVGGVDSRLAPGTQVGETVLIAKLNAAPLASGRVEADNYGGLYTGRNRLGASVDVNSPFGWGERFSARFMGSDSDLLYGRLAAQVPVNSRGLVMGAAVGRTTYALGDTFAGLDAVGRSTSRELFARYPLLRSVDANVYAQAAYEQRKLRDEVRSTATTTDKHAHMGTLSLQADARDGWGGGGSTQGSVALSQGRLGIDSPDAAALDAAGAQTVGRYTKWAWAVQRQQALGVGWSLGAQVRGQRAGQNLDSSEKLSLGGANGVRAYASGEATGDKGWLASLELRYAINPQVSASVFYDAGQVTVNAKPYLASPNTLRRSGTGLGLAGSYGAFDWQAAMAWRGGDAGTAEPDRQTRFWVQAGWRF